MIICFTYPETELCLVSEPRIHRRSNFQSFDFSLFNDLFFCSPSPTSSTYSTFSTFSTSFIFSCFHFLRHCAWLRLTILEQEHIRVLVVGSCVQSNIPHHSLHLHGHLLLLLLLDVPHVHGQHVQEVDHQEAKRESPRSDHLWKAHHYHPRPFLKSLLGVEVKQLHCPPHKSFRQVLRLTQKEQVCWGIWLHHGSGDRWSDFLSCSYWPFVLDNISWWRELSYFAFDHIDLCVSWLVAWKVNKDRKEPRIAPRLPTNCLSLIFHVCHYFRGIEKNKKRKRRRKIN